MTHKAKQRISWWLTSIGQALLIVSIVVPTMLKPLNKRFEACEQREEAMNIMFQNHLKEQKEVDIVLNRLQSDLRILNTLLERMNNELIDCRKSDQDLRDRLYDFLAKMKP